MQLVPIVFLVLSTIFMLSLFGSLFKLMDYKRQGGDLDFMNIIKICKVPLMTLFAFIIFVIVILPRLEGPK